MLAYEQRIVTELMTAQDPTVRHEVTTFVGESLQAMPEFLRLGIRGLSIGLTVRDRGRRLVGRAGDDAAELAILRGYPIGLVRQWVRALQSLVLFSENELLEARGCD